VSCTQREVPVLFYLYLVIVKLRLAAVYVVNNITFFPLVHKIKCQYHRAQNNFWTVAGVVLTSQTSFN